MNTKELPDFEEYAAEIKKLEDVPPAAIEISPLEAIALISHVQLATRHPALADKSGSTKVAIDVALQLQALFNSESTIYKVLELGWNSDEDLPRYTPPADLSWAEFFGLHDDDEDADDDVNGDDCYESFEGSNKYVVIRYLLAQNIVVMMDKIPNSTNMVF
jgi:hypothetical protein